MQFIAGVLYASGGMTWQILGPMGSDSHEEAITINFAFTRPPPARDARRIVSEELLRAKDVKWFSISARKWVIDLTLLRAFFRLPDEKFGWLNKVVIAEAEYNVLPDSFNRVEMKGVLSLVFDRPSVEDADELLLTSNRSKQQKFGILDAPNLVAPDLEQCKASLGGLGVAVIYFDLDHFKRLNAQLTETIVDRRIMPGIHQRIRESVSSLGFAYAEGGDEFIVVLPNANEAIATATAEAIRGALASLTFVVENAEYRITASFGVAASERWPIDELQEIANRAKREAKDQGRDRVGVARGAAV
jgi:diguanylate cyclase (GGDEF)-like protein